MNKPLNELTKEELIEIIAEKDDEYMELYEENMDIKCNKAIVITMGVMACVYFMVTIVGGFIDMLMW